MVRYRIEVNLRKCKRCAYCYSLDPTHFEPAPETGLFAKAFAKYARSYFLSKPRVIGGKSDKSKSVGTFDDDKIDMARQAEAVCRGSAITITEL
jgi:ferredoxin